MKKEVQIWESVRLFIFLLLFVWCLLFQINVNAEINVEKNLVNIYFFHSEDCSHCQKENVFLDILEEQYENVFVYRYEIHEEDNRDILDKVEQIYQIKISGVPITIIGDTVYTGYSEEKSPLKFVKTIEYYSRYGYEDKIGEALQLENLPFYKIEEDVFSLDDFIKSYENYQLIGSVYTDDLDSSLNAFILGVKSECNIINLFSIIIVLFSLTKIRENRNKIILLSLYLGLSFLLSTTYILSNQIFTLVIEILTLILFMIGLLGYNKNKKRQYLFGNILIVIAILSNYIENKFFNSPILILKTLIPLHNLSGMDKVIYYIDYLFANFMVELLILLLFYIIKRRIKKIS